MKKLGFGLMRLPLTNPDVPSSIDKEQFCLMIDKFIERGFTYFDTAWMYCGFSSEDAVKDCLIKRHKRDTFTLTTKLHSAFLKTLDDRDRIFNEQKRKTGAEFFDYYLIHDITKSHYEVYNELDCFSWIQEKKKAGLVNTIGFSFHDDAEFLDKVLTEHPEFEFVQLQLNYLDWESEKVQSRKCYETAVKHGKKVIVMEPVKGGTLANVPYTVNELFKSYEPDMSIPSWAIRFAASLDNVFMVLSGMSNMAQLLDNTGFMSDFKPLSEKEKDVCQRAAELIKSDIAIPCTGCSYCTEGCPKNIPIPKYFSLYNIDKSNSSSVSWTPQEENYRKLAGTFGKASECLHCGQCESVCPQHLNVIDNLEKVAEHFNDK